MLKTSLTIGLITVFSVIARFILNYLFTYYVSDVSQLDVYFSALSISSYVVNIIGGTLSAVLIPHLGSIEDAKERWKKYNGFMMFFIVITIFIGFVMYIYRNEIVEVVFHGYNHTKQAEIAKSTLR